MLVQLTIGVAPIKSTMDSAIFGRNNGLNSVINRFTWREDKNNFLVCHFFQLNLQLAVSRKF